MDRREFFQTGLGAVAAQVAAQSAVAQTPVPADRGVKMLKVDAYSRHLQ